MVKLIACVIVIDRLQTAMPSRVVVDSMTRVEVNSVEVLVSWGNFRGKSVPVRQNSKCI